MLVNIYIKKYMNLQKKKIYSNSAVLVKEKRWLCFNYGLNLLFLGFDEPSFLGNYNPQHQATIDMLRYIF